MYRLFLGRPWTKSLFPYLGFVRRFATTGTVEIPECVKREAELLYIKNTVNLIETHNILKSMVDNQFLSMQIMYAGRTDISIPKVDFLKEFSLSANDKHFSNKEQSLKILQDIIIP